MSMRPAAAAAIGVLAGMSALAITATPAYAESAAETQQADAPTTVAHRGASAYAPENTLAAVDKADDLGIDWVENDVQRTKDGQLIVMHDTTLDRTTDAEKVFPKRSPWKISDFTAAEIAKLDAGSWFSSKFKGQKVPTLKQYLDRVSKNHQKLLMELKSPEAYPGVEAQTLKQLNTEGWLDGSHTRSKLIIQSFNADSIRTVHSLRSEVKTGFLGNPATSELKSYASYVDQINPKYSTVSKKYISAIHAVKGAHGKPLQALAWTVNDASTARTMAAAGVDGIISNKPDVVRDATGG